MRILSVFGNIPLWGMEIATIELLTAQAARGHEVHAIVNGTWGQAIRSRLECGGVTCWPTPHWARLTLHPRQCRPLDILRAVTSVSRLTLKLIDELEPDLIHVPDASNFCHASLALLRAPRPIVVFAHNPPADRGPWKLVQDQLINRRASLVIATSRHAGGQLAKRRPAPRWIVAVPNPVPRARAGRPEAPPILLAPGLTSVVYAGQVTREKGVPDLLRAFAKVHARLPTTHLYILGDITWPPGMFREYEALLEELEAASFVTFVGYEERVIEFFSKCDLHVVPTQAQTETTPLVVLEAKAAGIPSVVTPSGGVSELIEDGVDGIVCGGTGVGDIAEGLYRALADRTWLVAAGAAARESAKRHSLEAYVEEIDRLYLQLLQRSSRAGSPGVMAPT